MSYTTSYGRYNTFTDTSAIGIRSIGSFTVQIVCSGDGQYALTAKNNPGGTYMSNTYGYSDVYTNTTTKFICCAMSKDGKYMAASELHQINPPSNTNYFLKLSNDYGKTWSNSNYTSNSRIVALTTSQTGIIFSMLSSGKVIKLINYGNTFVSEISISSTGSDLSAISASNTGKYVAICILNKLYLSNNNGDSYSVNNSFSDIIPVTDSSNCLGVKVSGNGKIIIVTVQAKYSGLAPILDSSGGIYISKDFGINWKKTNALSNIRWKRVVSSESGQYIYARGSPMTGVPSNTTILPVLYGSKDFGDNWYEIKNIGSTEGGSLYEGITTTSSGQYVLISNSNGGIYNYVANNYTYSYTPIKIAHNNKFNFTFTSTLYDCSGTYFLRNENNQTLSSKIVDVSYITSITFTDISTNSFDYGMSNLFVYKQNENEPNSGFDIQISDPMVINATCFLEGTKILAMDKKRILKYIPIEKLKPGMLVKTLYAGFVPIKYIGYSTIYNPGLATRVRDQLFVCKKSAYPELTEDLVLTGNHSVLVDTITNEEREQIIETLGDIYVTDRKYRLPAFNDKRAEPYDKRGDFRIWNLALENDNYYANYGIYANGLLVETTSCRYLKEISRMTLIE
jgi:hypothetical protein